MHRKLATAFVTVAASLGLLGAGALTSDASAATAPMTVCGNVVKDQAHCDASLLVTKGTHKLVHPTIASHVVSGRSAHMTAGAVAQPVDGSPQWLQQAYDLTSLSATKGAGDTVAIVDSYDDPGAATDLATFRSTYGLPACTEASGCLRVVNEQGASSPLPTASSAWAVEETLDLQAVSSICPNCNILLVEASSSGSGDLQTAMQTAVNLGANQISDSWSVTAGGAPFSALQSANGSALPAVFAAAGDAGADPSGEAEYPAALPTVTAVGGTSLKETSSASSARGYSESSWSNAGSGCATNEPHLSYQPATGCSGRAYSDVSADADPATGLTVYEAANGGWVSAGGTSLATPIVAAFDALTGINAQTPQWAYSDAAALNDPTGGSDGSCSSLLALMCNAVAGYDGPTGAGSISGAVVAGAPGVAGPTFENGGSPTDASAVTKASATLSQGLYSNDEATSYYWQYGTTSSYGAQTASGSLAAGTQAALASANLVGLSAGTTYHYRLVAVNASGTSYGSDFTFTTSGSASTVSAAQASGPSTTVSTVGKTTTVKKTTSAKKSTKKVVKKATKTKKVAKKAAKTKKASKAKKAAKTKKSAKAKKTATAKSAKA